MALKIVVDPIACDAFGHCAELAPELLSLDEWGYPVVEHDVTSETRSLANQVVKLCPRRAITLRER